MRTDWLPEVPVWREGGHDHIGITGVQGGLVAADHVTRRASPGSRIGALTGRRPLPATGCSKCATPPTIHPVIQPRLPAANSTSMIVQA